MTLQKKRAKLVNIELQLDFWDQVQKGYEEFKGYAEVKTMNIPLSINNPTRNAVQAILEAHIRSQKEQLQAAFEDACKIVVDGKEVAA